MNNIIKQHARAKQAKNKEKLDSVIEEKIKIFKEEGTVKYLDNSIKECLDKLASADKIDASNHKCWIDTRTKKVKTKGEVTGGGDKPWRQKGTGQARQGSTRNPQWRHGGVAHGPTGRENYSLNINKKLKKKVLQSLLGEKMRNKEIIIIDKIELENYKTQVAENMLNNLPRNCRQVAKAAVCKTAIRRCKSDQFLQVKSIYE
ncbi:7578_t:CDS:2 [Ambispora gerdemannii]|uniref:Large ribosomal subunit protein uL4m n=1 Tax=Ambispora gerdemannii TaxID=144530 RepID=A0A9N8ZU26_9GLOM|nr:7578_t:CDS:2 [Ambispora gerdemannii]